MMNIEELRKIFCEDGLYAVCVENGNLVSHYRIMCLRKNGAALINFVDARVTDGFILREGEFVTSLQALKEIGIKAGLNRPGFPGECFICELRLPDHRFRWKHNKLFLLLPEEYGPAFPAIVDCYTSPPT